MLHPSRVASLPGGTPHRNSMNSGTICGRHFANGEAIELRWENGVIESIRPVSTSDTNTWLAPALVDLQINGYGGIDFQQDTLTTDDMVSAVRHLNRDGCTRFLLTLITDDWSRLIARLRHLHQLRESNPVLRHAIAGWHIEGPFLSAEPGFCGAHDPAFMRDPKPADFDELRRIVVQKPEALLTVDPGLATAPPEQLAMADAPPEGSIDDPAPATPTEPAAEAAPTATESMTAAEAEQEPKPRNRLKRRKGETSPEPAAETQPAAPEPTPENQ